MTPPARRADWVSLLDGVRVSRQWMAANTPELLDAWRTASTAARRRAIAVRIVQTATQLELAADAAGTPLDAVPDSHSDSGSLDHRLRDVAERIDPRLVRGPDWLPLAAACARAAAAGYDLDIRLPALAAGGLPATHPARELHWRLLEDCPAALPLPDTTHRAVANAVPGADPRGHTRSASPQIPPAAPTDPVTTTPSTQPPAPTTPDTWPRRRGDAR